jgi:hypothetical protein
LRIPYQYCGFDRLNPPTNHSTLAIFTSDSAGHLSGFLVGSVEFLLSRGLQTWMRFDIMKRRRFMGRASSEGQFLLLGGIRIFMYMDENANHEHYTWQYAIH